MVKSGCLIDCMGFGEGMVPGCVSPSISSSQEVMGVFGADTREDVVQDRIWESPMTVRGCGGYFVLELISLLLEGVPKAHLAWFCVESDACSMADASVLCSDDITSDNLCYNPPYIFPGSCSPDPMTIHLPDKSPMLKDQPPIIFPSAMPPDLINK